jgi:ABC-2 type transport system permease protein
MARVTEYSIQVMAVADAEVRKLWHDPMELFTRAIQPVLWLLLYGEVMGHVGGLSSNGLPYLDFLAPGILAQSVLFIAIFYGISAIWERDMGVLQRYLVSPAPRSALVLGKALTSAVRALSQAIVVYLISLAIGITLTFEPLHLLGAVAMVALGAGVFATFSLVVACIVRTRERFMGMSQVLTMPVFFASNAIYPLDLMPGWLLVVARVNPLTYEVDALRELMLRGGVSTIGIGTDFAALSATFAVLVTIAALLYPRMGR